MRTDAGKRALPDCINAGNPYHECVDFCSLRIAAEKAKAAAAAASRLEDDGLKAPPAERTVHPDCPNAGNPYHQCGDDCFRKIIQARERIKDGQSALQPEDGAPDGFEKSEVPLDDKEPSQMGQNDDSTDNDKIPVQTGQPDENDIQHDTEADYPILNERQKKLLELSLKMSEARKANQTAMVAEKKKMEAPTESRGVSKQTWIEDRKKKIGKLLDSNGLDMSKAYMLDTQDQAQAKYKKWEKDPAPSRWEGPQRIQHWVKPAPGLYKLNVDAGQLSDGRMTTGGVCRDHHGLQLLLQQGYQEVQIETDSKVVVTLLQDQIPPFHSLYCLAGL